MTTTPAMTAATAPTATSAMPKAGKREEDDWLPLGAAMAASKLSTLMGCINWPMAAMVAGSSVSGAGASVAGSTASVAGAGASVGAAGAAVAGAAAEEAAGASVLAAGWAEEEAEGASVLAAEGAAEETGEEGAGELPWEEAAAAETEEEGAGGAVVLTASLLAALVEPWEPEVGAGEDEPAPPCVPLPP